MGLRPARRQLYTQQVQVGVEHVVGIERGDLSARVSFIG